MSRKLRNAWGAGRVLLKSMWILKLVAPCAEHTGLHTWTDVLVRALSLFIDVTSVLALLDKQGIKPTRWIRGTLIWRWLARLATSAGCTACSGNVAINTGWLKLTAPSVRAEAAPADWSDTCQKTSCTASEWYGHEQGHSIHSVKPTLTNPFWH